MEHVGIDFSLGGGTNFVLSYVWIAVSFGVAFFLPNAQQFMARHDPTLLPAAPAPARETTRPAASSLRHGVLPHWQPTLTWAVVTGVMLAGGVSTLSSVTEFLYFQF